MIGNLSKVQGRLESYFAAPDKRFSIKSQANTPGAQVKEKVRQYWADPDVSNVKKLQGFNINLRGFDPRNTTSKELFSVATMLSDLGIIDEDLVSTIANVDVEFDNQGKEIYSEKQVDAYAYFKQSLEFLKKHISNGDDYSKSTLIDLNAAIAVVKALEERGKTPLAKSLVNIRA
jgi:hypothetical protein